ncbi:MAG: M56 family metallopeptidase [Pseudomonadota bacterium]
MSWSDLHPIIQEAGNTTLAVALLCLLVLLIRRPFAERFGAKAAYTLWLVPLARFFMPPLPQNWSLSGWLGLGQTRPLAQPVQSATVEAAPVWQASPAQKAVAETTPFEITTFETARVVEEIAPVPVDFIPAVGQTSESTSSWLMAAYDTSTAFLATNWVGIAVLVWGLGALVWLARGFRRQDVFMRLVRTDSEPAPADVIANAKLIASEIGLRRAPEVRMSLLSSGPLVTGLARPVVLLPLWFKEDYTPSERRDALIHELMHLKRKDLWAYQMARLMTATQWFNPLAHVALHAFRTDQEAACDADVLKQKSVSKAEYGRTLIKAARLARPSDRRFATASLTLAHPIKERIKLMTKPTPTLRSRLTGTAIAGAIGAGALFATASAVSNAQELNGGNDTEQTVYSDDSQISITIDGETYTMALDDLPPMPAMPPMPAFPDIGGLDFSGGNGQFSLNIDTDRMIADGDWEAFETAMEAWGEEMEAWGEAFEADGEKFEVAMEAWGEEMEAWGEDFGAKMEAWAEENEPKIEAWAEKMAEKHEDKTWVQFEDREPETRDITISDFDEVDISSGMKVIYSQGPEPSAKAVLTRGEWDDVEVEVSGGALSVGRADNARYNMGRGPMVTVYATSTSLDYIDISSGSSFEGDLVASDLKVDASSGSTVALAGTCASIEVDASSGTRINAGSIECEEGNVDASSGSSIIIYASKSAVVDASSGASITILGSPTDVDSDKSSGASIRLK